jgi:hypothetical protein
MFDFNEAPTVTDADLVVSIALSEARDEAIAAWLDAEREQANLDAADRLSMLCEEVDAQQDLRWATKG